SCITAWRSRLSQTPVLARGSSAFLRGRRLLCTQHSPAGVSRACGAGRLSGHTGVPSDLLRQLFFFRKALSTCFLMSPYFFPTSFSSSSVKSLNGTRTTLLANFTLSQYCPYLVPLGTGK